MAKAIGFNVPCTMVTTDKRNLLSFAKKNSKIVIMPIAKGRVNYIDNTSKLIFTNIMEENILRNIDSFETTPAIYQEYIEEEYELRVTVVGSDVFAAKLDSQAESETSVDWRRKKIKFKRYDLPEALMEKCLLLLERLNITFGAFDLIKTTNELYYFLEVNLNGQWFWIEKDSDQRIAESIIKYLTY